MSTETFNRLVSFGFLPDFIELYFRRMLDLGIAENKAFEFFMETYKKNYREGNFTNVYDVIELAKGTTTT